MRDATPRTIYSGKFVAKEKLDRAEAELAALRRAAQALYDSKFKDPKTGNQCVAFCELEKMAALLQERGNE